MGYLDHATLMLSNQVNAFSSSMTSWQQVVRLKATIEMIEKLGGVVAGCAFLIELDDLKGREAIGDYDYKVLMHY